MKDNNKSEFRKFNKLLDEYRDQLQSLEKKIDNLTAFLVGSAETLMKIEPDVYTWAASSFYGVPEDQVTRYQRNCMKMRYFAAAYGLRGLDDGPKPLKQFIQADLENLRRSNVSQQQACDDLESGVAIYDKYNCPDCPDH